MNRNNSNRIDLDLQKSCFCVDWNVHMQFHFSCFYLMCEIAVCCCVRQSDPSYSSSFQDYSFVYKPELCQAFVGCSMFAPLKTLPSQCLATIKIPEDCIYRPSWTMGRELLNPLPVMTFLNKDRYNNSSCSLKTSFLPYRAKKNIFIVS